MKHQINHSKINHRFTTGGQCFIVFAQPPILAKPRKRPLNNPTPRKHNKTVDIITSLNNLHYPLAGRGTPVNQLASVTTVCPNQRQPRKQIPQFFQNQFGPVTILNTGRMYDYCKHQTERIYDQMPFSPAYFLAGVITTFPPFSAVLTDWLSIIAAEGHTCLPASIRTCSRRLL